MAKKLKRTGFMTDTTSHEDIIRINKLHKELAITIRYEDITKHSKLVEEIVTRHGFIFKKILKNPRGVQFKITEDWIDYRILTRSFDKLLVTLDK